VFNISLCGAAARALAANNLQVRTTTATERLYTPSSKR